MVTTSKKFNILIVSKNIRSFIISLDLAEHWFKQQSGVAAFHKNMYDKIINTMENKFLFNNVIMLVYLLSEINTKNQALQIN